MSALLCQYGATSADAAHTQRLQRALDQYKSENQTLLSKLHRLEKQQAEATTAQQQRKYASAFVDFGNKAEYIQFLEQELEQVK
jgi:DNA repair exonuclease SbcCD ATPase subunit